MRKMEKFLRNMRISVGPVVRSVNRECSMNLNDANYY